MRLAFLLFPLLALGCDSSGPVGLVDYENGVRAEVTASGIVVENTKGEPIYAVAYGEYAMIYVDPEPQTLGNPGRGIGPDGTTTFAFDPDGLVRRNDDRYGVYWITIKGEGSDRHIGERGELELAR